MFSVHTSKVTQVAVLEITDGHDQGGEESLDYFHQNKQKILLSLLNSGDRHLFPGLT